MPSLKVRVVGCGEAFEGSGLGNTSILMEASPRSSLLVDCGYQIPERLWRSGAHKSLQAVAFTHLHADHAFGMVPLLTRYWEEKRTRPLEVIGPKATQGWIESALRVGYPGLGKRLTFEIRYHVISANEPVSLTLGGRKVKVRGARTHHSVLNHTLRFDWGRSGSVSVSGDGQVKPETLKLVEGVDVHFQECYSLKPLFETHADFQTLWSAWGRPEASLAPREIALTHAARGERDALIRKVNRLRIKDQRWRVAVPDEVWELF